MTKQNSQTESGYESKIAELTAFFQPIGTVTTTVADKRMIPRSIALAAADYLGVPVSPARTATEICIDILDAFDYDLSPDPESVLDKQPDSVDAESGRLAAGLLSLLRTADAPAESELDSTKHTALQRLANPEEAAKNKLEAVNRISAITHSGPQSLGPGSKERKSVLTNLAVAFFSDIDTEKNKIALFQDLVRNLGGTSEDSDFSSGYTITLRGLNKLYELATAYQRIRNGGVKTAPEESPKAEADSYLGVIATALGLAASSTRAEWASRSISGYEAVEEMFSANYKHRRQTEWFGWYTEFVGIPALKKNFGGGPVSIENTEFDYQGIRTWDLKAHTSKDSMVPLNDKEAIIAAIDKGGLGFLIVRGSADFENEAQFYRWHLAMRGKNPDEKERKPNSRKLKVNVRVTSLDAFCFANRTELQQATEDGILVDFNQGHQADGSLRKVKLKLDLDKALDSRFLITSLEIPQPTALD